MINKVLSTVQEAIADVSDGTSIMVGGFGLSGTPYNLVMGLIEKKVKRLTFICNSFNNIIFLEDRSQVAKVVMSFPIAPSRGMTRHPLEAALNSGDIDLELVPQGTLVERMRAAGAGLAGFYTPTGVGTIIERGKEKRQFDGKEYILEKALKADFAFIKAYKADKKGQSHVPDGFSEFQSDNGDGGQCHHRRSRGNSGARRHRPRNRGYAGYLRKQDHQSAPTENPVHPTAQITTGQVDMRGLSRELIALRVAKELREGMYINLGIGLPTLVPQWVPGDIDVIFQSENGILGYGPIAEEGEQDPDLVDAGAQPITLKPGASFFHSADSFAMIRGRHVDLSILGGYQVSEKGDLANWSTSKKGIGSIGGAMDLACGSKQLWVAMEHTSSRGELRIVKECSYPLTATRVVRLIFTNLAVIEVTVQGLVIREVAPGISAQEVQKVTEPELIISPKLHEMAL